MAFDPFGDHAEKGYLRNFAGASDPDVVKRLEHRSVVSNIEEALANLQTGKPLTYRDVLKTHETLFKDMYPWAGKDRFGVAREEAELTGDASKRNLGGIVTKGPVTFMPSSHAERGVDYALMIGNDPDKMRSTPGEVMGHLAYAHPFLDGNGRTLMAVHSELAARAGIYIDWSQTTKADYLAALTSEINDPGSLDSYLKPFVREGALSLTDRQEVFSSLPGLSKPDERPTLTIIAGPEGSGRDEAASEIKLESASDFVKNPADQLNAIKSGKSLTVSSALSDDRTGDLVDQAKAAGFEIHVNFVGKEGLGEGMNQSLQGLSQLAAQVDSVRIFENEGSKVRELGHMTNASLVMKEPTSWAVDAVLDGLSAKLAKTDQLSEKRQHLDRIIEAASAGTDAHKEIAERAEAYKQKLEGLQTPERERSAPKRSDEGYGL
jgi:cell filamentation protein